MNGCRRQIINGGGWDRRAMKGWRTDKVSILLLLDNTLLSRSPHSTTIWPHIITHTIHTLRNINTPSVAIIQQYRWKLPSGSVRSEWRWNRSGGTGRELEVINQKRMRLSVRFSFVLLSMWRSGWRCNDVLSLQSGLCCGRHNRSFQRQCLGWTGATDRRPCVELFCRAHHVVGGTTQ